MLAHLAFAVERRRRPVDGIGLQQHFAQVGEGTVGHVMNLEQLVSLAELGQQVRHIRDHLRIADPNLLRIVAAYQFLKKLTQWMRFRNHACPPETPFCSSAFSKAWYLVTLVLTQTQVTFVYHSYHFR